MLSMKMTKRVKGDTSSAFRNNMKCRHCESKTWHDKRSQPYAILTLIKHAMQSACNKEETQKISLRGGRSIRVEMVPREL